MSPNPKDEPALPRTTASSWTGGEIDETGSPLPPQVQEHLAQQLRAAYQETAEKPAFLGDPALPPELEAKVAELAERERFAMRAQVHEIASEAVEAALEEVVASGVVAEPAARAGKRPRKPGGS
jgi:hypothetical protein